MPKKINSNTTKQYLESAPLPTNGNTYTIISHKFIIDSTLALLKANNLEVETELYKSNLNAEIASGAYYIKGATDPEISMMFGWANSYDKSMRFKCSIGARVHVNGCNIIAGDMANWGRVHKGTADVDTYNTIQDQIQNASRYFNQLVSDKKLMKDLTVTKSEQSELLGLLWSHHDYVTAEQANIIKREIKKPTFDYNMSEETLWVFYNAILVGIKTSHPKNWLDRQRNIHWLLCNKYAIGNYTPVAKLTKQALPANPSFATSTSTMTPVIPSNINFSLDPTLEPEPTSEEVISNQIDLEDMINEVEQEDSFELEGLKVTPEVRQVMQDIINDVPVPINAKLVSRLDIEEETDTQQIDKLEESKEAMIQNEFKPEEVKPSGFTPVGDPITLEGGLVSFQAGILDLSEPKLTSEQQAQIDENIRLMNSKTFEL